MILLLILSTPIFDLNLIMEHALEYGIAPAIVVGIYLIIIKILDNKKEKHQAKINANVLNALDKISTFLDNITNNIINKDKDKCKFAINNSFNAFQSAVVEYAINTIIKNHILENKTYITENVERIVKSQFYNTHTALSMYNINDINISSNLKVDWIKEITREVIKIIYSNNSTNDKICNLINSLSIKFDGYISYVTNKSL